MMEFALKMMDLCMQNDDFDNNFKQSLSSETSMEINAAINAKLRWAMLVQSPPATTARFQRLKQHEASPSLPLSFQSGCHPARAT